MGSGKFFLNDGSSRLFTSLEPFGSAVLENYCLINADEEEEDSQTPIQKFASENFSFSCKQNWEFAIFRDEREVNLLGMFPSPASVCTKDRKRLNQRRLNALPRRPKISVFLLKRRKNSALIHTASHFSDEFEARNERTRKICKQAFPCTPCWMRCRRMNDYGEWKNKILEFCGREPKLFSHHRTAFLRPARVVAAFESSLHHCTRNEKFFLGSLFVTNFHQTLFPPFT